MGYETGSRTMSRMDDGDISGPFLFKDDQMQVETQFLNVMMDLGEHGVECNHAFLFLQQIRAATS